jgi:hypothetical protein
MGAVDFRWLRATYMRHMADDLNEKRLRAEILADAIKELVPQDEQEMCAQLTRYMKGLRAIARGKKAPTLGNINQQRRARLKRMQRVRADLVVIGAPPDSIEAFDRQLRVAESMLNPAVPPGAHQLNDTAACAVAIARDLLQGSGRMRWARWCRLASLLYEGATGETAFDFPKYITKHKEGRFVATPLGIAITGTTQTVAMRDGTLWITDYRSK